MKCSVPDLRLSELILIPVGVTHEMSVCASQASGSDRRVAALSGVSRSFPPTTLDAPLPFSVTFRDEECEHCHAELDLHISI